jgi:integrin alpha FG-GAP repeat containing protein 1
MWDENRSITLRIGDYNLDGFPDILVPLINLDGSPTIELWKNIDCDMPLCGAEAAYEGRRGFGRVTTGVDALVNTPNPYAATFFDLDESGVLDLLVLCSPLDKSGAPTKTIEAVFNNFFNDAFFLKTMGLNGHEDGLTAPKSYGVNLPGGVFKFTISELSGIKRAAQGVQLQQSGNLALQTPYILFGLGRTSNYIEEFYMGVTINNQDHSASYWHMWICIIPNSQLVAIPYKPTDPDNWTLELYIKTSGLLLQSPAKLMQLQLQPRELIQKF